MTAQLSAPAIGYRAFKWDGSGPLKSIGVEASWPITRDPQRAKCIQTTDPAHAAPKEDCTCGLHAHSKPESVSGWAIGGVVMGYGRLIIHPDGWRSEFAELVALVKRDHLTSRQRQCVHEFGVRAATLVCWRCGATMQATETAVPGLDLLAQAYGVRVLNGWEDAAAIAREYGAEPVPEILHAEAEAWLLGPEKHEPLFPDGMSSRFGDLEARIRHLLPWIRRELIVMTEMHQEPDYRYVASGTPVVYPAAVTLRLRVFEPKTGAQVEVELRA